MDSIDMADTVVETEEVESCFVFEDSKHHDCMFSSLNNLRRSGQFSDVKLMVEEHEVPAHRAILASVSPMLFDIFTNGENLPTPKYIYKLRDIEFTSFEHLLNYIYSGRLEVPASEVNSVYRAATQLRMAPAVQACAGYLADHLTAETCLGIRVIAADEDFKVTLDRFIQDNIKELSTSKNFFVLPRVQVQVIGAEEDLFNSTNEKVLFDLVVDWVKNNMDGKSPNLDSLTEQVNVLYLNRFHALQDCKDTIDDFNLNEDDAVKDYKKLSKRKKSKPLSRDPSPPNVNFHKFSLNSDSQPMLDREWSVIASYETAERTYMAIGMLNGAMATMSLQFRPPQSSPYHSASDGADSPVNLHMPQLPSFERHASLTRLANMSTARCGFGLEVLNDKLVACGGYDRGECLNTVECFDLTRNVWTLLNAMTTPRGRMSMAEMDGKLYVCGGSDGHNELKTVEFYDFELDKWTRVADMFKEKSNIGVAVMDSKLYCVSGCRGQKSLSYCEMYDPELDSWQTIAPLQEARSQASVCVLNGQLYAIGGTDGWSCLNSVEVYSPEVNAWQLARPLNTARRGASAYVFNGKIYVVGGSDGAQSLRLVEIYDPDMHTWTIGPSLSKPRSNVGVAVCQNRLMAVGGFSGKKFLDCVEYLDTVGNEWCGYLPVDGSKATNGVPVSCQRANGAEINGQKSITNGNVDYQITEQSSSVKHSNRVTNGNEVESS